MKSIYISLLIVGAIIYSACNSEDTYDGVQPSLSTSLDTLAFDTVFTSIGSATKSFKIYNKEDQDVYVDIAIKNQNSPYRLNIDGSPSNNKEDVLIRANDSIYVFADVTVDPDQPLSVSPFFIEDQIKISSKETEKEVLLTAYGQNANYLTAKKKGSGGYISCGLDDLVLDDPKPYVIYGILYIDSCNVVLPAGTNLYVHGGVVTRNEGGRRFNYQDGRIIFLENGSVQANGTLENPVTFQGDRLEENYENVSGQWYGLQLLEGSRENIFNHTTIKNSIYGLQIDSSGTAALRSCKLLNNAARGVEAKHANVSLENSLIANTGGEGLVFGYGGNYEVIQSTIANYSNTSAGLVATNYFCNPNDCASTLRGNPLSLKIINSIIVGDADDEIFIDDQVGTTYLDLELNNNIVKSLEFLEVPGMEDFLTTKCNDCINYKFPVDPLFVDPSDSDYHLIESSIAKDRGIRTKIDRDLDGVKRDDKFDIGCYESIFK